MKKTALLHVLFLFISTALCACSKSDEINGSVDKPVLTVSKNEIIVDPSGSTEQITVTSDRDFSITASKTWISAEYAADQNENNLTVRVEENPAASERVAALLISVPGGPLTEILVRQRAASSLPEVEEEGIHVKAASYNIRVAAAADETTGNGWNTRKVPLANLIINHQLDIVGTQEGNFSQMGDLMTLLPDYDYLGYPYAGASSRSHTASIIYKKAKYEIVQDGVFWYSETPDVESIGWDATDTRICTWARMKHKDSGQEFYFFSSHFYWRNYSAKRNSGAVMVQKIKEIVQDNLPVISVGDLNSPPSSPQYLEMLTLLSDSYELTETPRSGPEGTTLSGGVFSGTPGARIDYILVDGPVRVLSYAVLPDTYGDGRYPSDHLPVVSNLFLRK